MLILATATFTVEIEGLRAPQVIGQGEFADIPNGAAQQALQQGTARPATLAEAAGAQQKEIAPEAPVRPFGGKRSNQAGKG
jgi:hypothetical protein